MIKVLFITDSLSLPRETALNKVGYDQTYPYILKEKFKNKIDFYFLGIGGANVNELLSQSNYVKLYNPDYLFIHLGIVDAAPRSFTTFEKAFLNRFRLNFLAKPLAPYIRKIRRISATKPNTFARNLVSIKKNFIDTKELFAIGILPSSESYEKKLKGITKNIKIYNNILRENFTFIDNSDFPFDGILDDFHHLNVKGHKILSAKLAKILESKIN